VFVQTSQAGINFIKRWEGYSPKAYRDIVGVETIGYGHVIRHGEHFSTLTESEATKLLCRDLERFEAAVESLVEIELNSSENDALVSFCFNLGRGALAKSTLLKKLNDGDREGAAKEFPKWCRANGKLVQGLLNRRNEEAEMFLG